MANIFLTRKCNLKCPYCFADEFVNKENEEYTLENFQKAINFIKTDKDERIGLIGGEPTLYPHFKEVLEILNNDNDISSYIIYTNGLELDKYIDEITNKKTQILINCNSPSDLGKRYEKLKDNIKLLISKNYGNFTLGINLYSAEFDYSYIFDLLKISQKHNLRFSTSLPNSEKEEVVDALDSFRKIKPFLIRFFEDCCKNEIIPQNDCNAIPHCILDTEDKKLLLKLKLLADKYKMANTIITARACSPVIDIFPDLTAVRCFGLAKNIKVPVEQFKSPQTLRMYFQNKTDLYAKVSWERKECEDCKSRIFEKCGLCYTYKLKKCSKIKNMILDNTL